MSGTLVNGDLIFAGINSHGDPTYMKGRKDGPQFGVCTLGIFPRVQEIP